MASGHGGVTLGSEMSGGIDSVFVENIRMNSSELDIALRFKTNTRRGGVMRNYYARNVDVPNGVSANSGAITIDYFYRADSSDDPAESGPYDQTGYEPPLHPQPGHQPPTGSSRPYEPGPYEPPR